MIGKSPLNTEEKGLTPGLKTKHELSLGNPHLNISTPESPAVLRRQAPQMVEVIHNPRDRSYFDS